MISNWAYLFILFTINLLNYIDRFQIAGALPYLISYFKISYTTAGLLQSCFITAYMLVSPLAGYLGDRYNRKWIALFGLIIWILMTLLSSFSTPDRIGMFFACRAFVGIGEACFVAVSPTLVSDIFPFHKRSMAMGIIFLSVPAGSGLGYISGSLISSSLGWQWAFRITPILGALLLLAGAVFLYEPQVGQNDDDLSQVPLSDYKTDIRMLAQNRTYLLVALGNIGVAYSTGAMAYWIPEYAHLVLNSSSSSPSLDHVTIICGSLVTLGGLFGVLIGSALSKRLQPISLMYDPQICGFGMMLSSVFTLYTLYMLSFEMYSAFLSLFLGVTSISTTFSLNVNILMYIVAPHRRATSVAISLFTQHAFGDAASPYIVGLIASQTSRSRNSQSLRWGLITTVFASVLGSCAFLAAGEFIEKDAKAVRNELEREPLEPNAEI